MAAAAMIDSADPKALRDRQSRSLRLVPALSGRDRGPARERPRPARRPPRRAWSCTRRPRGSKLRRGRDGALYLRPSARLPDLQRERRLRIADAGRRIVGLRDVRYGYDGANHRTAPTDSSNPYFTFEPSKCIVCSRCVRACEEVQGTFALTILGRGFDSQGLSRRSRLPASNAFPAAPAFRPVRPRR